MSSPKVIAVFGATGAQGGSVVQSLLKNRSGAFAIRGITRNTGSDKAKALSEEGVEMVQADGLVKDQISKALEGAWGVFVNTNSDDPAIGQPDRPSETDLGKIIIDAAAEAGVQHFVYSGMASASETTNGAVPNKGFDEKHAVGEYAKAKSFTSVAIVSPGWYLENHLAEQLAPLFGGFPFSPDEEGYLTLKCPRWGGNEEIPFISIGDDYGDIVHGIFLSPEDYNGQLIQAVSQSATATQLVEAFQKFTGKRSRFTPLEDWRSFETYGDRGLELVKYMFGFCQYSGGLYYGVPNNMAVASQLKSRAQEAQGKDGGLMTLDGFFAQYFST
ncbi:unnamed protein product [Clonostachys chloroleuca]|uniref:NmrA-like domain-containing protein n=1 Tax=Clonostachys chloroleuca TaxID=1926264 RepID=A0AA35MGT5_9HYPO|nr:unnamed protein product [Clonostachys chloroleuca]